MVCACVRVLPLAREELRGKRLVDLNQVHVRELEVGPSKRALRGKERDVWSSQGLNDHLHGLEHSVCVRVRVCRACVCI